MEARRAFLRALAGGISPRGSSSQQWLKKMKSGNLLPGPAGGSSSGDLVGTGAMSGEGDILTW